jgi:hypothetical protein
LVAHRSDPTLRDPADDPSDRTGAAGSTPALLRGINLVSGLVVGAFGLAAITLAVRG